MSDLDMMLFILVPKSCVQAPIGIFEIRKNALSRLRQTGETVSFLIDTDRFKSTAEGLPKSFYANITFSVVV